MTKWLKPLLLSSVICSPVTFADFNCDNMRHKTFYEQKKMFCGSRDEFFGQLQLEKYADIVVETLRTTSADSMTYALWVKDIPDQILKNKEQLDVPEEGWDARMEYWQKSIRNLEAMAQCYHYGEVRESPLMMLKLYDRGPDTEVVFGYLTTTLEGNLTRIARVTKAEKCYNRACSFSEVKLPDLEKTTAVRLAHHPEAVAELTTDLSPKPFGSPVITLLTGLELKKTGEVFTDPEIFMSVVYTGKGLSPGTDSVDIPWAISKGPNKGRTQLFNWQDYTTASVLIMEDDMDIPFARMIEIIKVGVDVAIKRAASGDDDISLLDSVRAAIAEKDTGGDSSLANFLEGLNTDDVIDEFVVLRESAPDSVVTKEGYATVTLSHMYKKDPDDKSATDKVHPGDSGSEEVTHTNSEPEKEEL